MDEQKRKKKSQLELTFSYGEIDKTQVNKEYNFKV